MLCRTLRRRHRALAAAALLAAAGAAAQTLPPPPTSPAPVTRFEYDANGNRTRAVTAPDLATTTTYDSLGRRKDSTDPLLARTRWQFNGRDDLIQLVDPRGLSTRYPRTGFGQALAVISPDTGTTSNSFDAVGNLLTRTDSRGVVSTHTYDALNRLTRIQFQRAGTAATQIHSWGYDQTGPGFAYGIGRLTSTSYPGGGTTHRYDALGRPVGISQVVDLGKGPLFTLSVGYGWDAAGRLTSITYPSGRVLSIGRNGGLARWLTLAPDASSAGMLLLSQIEHDPAPGSEGAVQGWNWHFNQHTERHERVFDTHGRMVRHPLGGAVRDIHYDPADRIVAYTHLDRLSGTATAAAQALNQAFGYDGAGRLASVATSVGSWSYGYDANGNRLVQTTTAGAAAQTRNASIAADSNRLLALDNPPRSLAHDAAGNTTADWQMDGQGSQAWQAEYDLSGRLARIQATLGGRTTTTDYRHNTAGQRVLKLPVATLACMQADTQADVDADPLRCAPGPAGAGTAYLHDTEGHLLGEYRLPDGAPLREYIWLHDMPVAVLAYDHASAADTAPVFYIHTDHLDTPRVVLDKSGAQRWSWVAEPFGNSRPQESALGRRPFELNLRMPGQYFDKETGLSQNWHREYDAGVGRYTQSDPIGLAGGINTYSYANADPVESIDPKGLAYFAKRRLARTPWLATASCSPGGLGDRLNTELSHEHLFFEDSLDPPNIGYGPKGLFTESAPTGYRCSSRPFNDCVMRKAVALVRPKPYCLIAKPGQPQYNCQDWSGEVRAKYQQLMSEAEVRRECFGCTEW